jgi:hypothetical protein
MYSEPHEDPSFTGFFIPHRSARRWEFLHDGEFLVKATMRSVLSPGEEPVHGSDSLTDNGG